MTVERKHNEVFLFVLPAGVEQITEVTHFFGFCQLGGGKSTKPVLNDSISVVFAGHALHPELLLFHFVLRFLGNNYTRLFVGNPEFTIVVYFHGGSSWITRPDSNNLN
jgi:hypothetical protein